ncbi:MAG: hypothetical protein Q9170_006610 [Blastenia crenularia]
MFERLLETIEFSLKTATPSPEDDTSLRKILNISTDDNVQVQSSTWKLGNQLQLPERTPTTSDALAAANQLQTELLQAISVQEEFVDDAETQAMSAENTFEMDSVTNRNPFRTDSIHTTPFQQRPNSLANDGKTLRGVKPISVHMPTIAKRPLAPKRPFSTLSLFDHQPMLIDWPVKEYSPHSQQPSPVPEYNVEPQSPQLPPLQSRPMQFTNPDQEQTSYPSQSTSPFKLSYEDYSLELLQQRESWPSPYHPTTRQARLPPNPSSNQITKSNATPPRSSTADRIPPSRTALPQTIPIKTPPVPTEPQKQQHTIMCPFMGLSQSAFPAASSTTRAEDFDLQSAAQRARSKRVYATYIL